MICPKCGANNIDGSSYCVKCGINLQQTVFVNPTDQSIPVQAEPSMNVTQEQIVQTQPVQSVVNQQPANFQNSNVNVQQNFNSQSNVNPGPIQKAALLGGITFNTLISFLTKPFKIFKDKENDFSNQSTALIFSAIIAGVMFLINILKSCISVVFTKSYDYSSYKMKTTMSFENLKYIQWGELIGRNLLICFGIIVAIAFVYYIIGLIFKKNLNFSKLLSITSLSLIPWILLGSVVSPLLGLIWYPLAFTAFVVGSVYSILIFIYIINEDLQFESVDKKIMFNLICLSILAISGYFLSINFTMSVVTSEFDEILDILG